MKNFFYWLKTRWRTRAEYAGTGRRGLFRLLGLGRGVALRVVVIILVLLGIGWVLGEPSRSGGRAIRLEGLADSVVVVVERGGHGPFQSLDDFVAAGLFTRDDLEFLADQGVTFHPITRQSPDTAVVFRQLGGGGERLYRKDGTKDWYTSAVSPDGRLSVVVGPAPRTAGARPAHDARSVTVRQVGDGRILGSLLVPLHATAHWSPDGRFVAVQAGLDGADRATATHTFVLAVGASGVRRLDLPREVEPERLLAPEDRDVKFQTTSTRVLGWRGSNLRVESTGHGWSGPPGEAGSQSLTLRCRFAFEVSESGVREVGREMTTYAKR